MNRYRRTPGANRRSTDNKSAHFGAVLAALVAGTVMFWGAPGKIRTCDTFFRREVLFP